MDQTTPAPETGDVPLHLRRDGFDPVAELATYRNSGEIPAVNTYGMRAYLVTRYEDVREVFGDPTRFGNTADMRRLQGSAMSEVSDEEESRMRIGNLLAQDPPEHTRLRRMLTREFTRSRMRQLRPRISEIVDDKLDALEKAGPPADLVSDFAMPIPSLVICELLGVPYADRDGFQERSKRLVDVSLKPDERLAAAQQSRDYMSTLCTEARTDPGDDILGALVRDHGDELTHEELTGVANLLLVAGHETTANMLGLGTLALLRHPDQAALVRADNDAVRPAVEELLRWLSILHAGEPRLVMRDTEIRGIPIPAGALVLCSLPAANRDPEQVADPDTLDVRRGTAGHVAFGHGIHHCLGAPLARMEMETAFPALLRRFPHLATTTGDDFLEFRSLHFIYGLHALPVTW